ncbi:DUF3558 family protein [Gordonia sp. ABSL1-1]|uniref:DUF3558 family protein n=1 Tax=Gordonia sp. ABSL1-1 TaxID=3053923 RepID=UPI0033656DDA
MWRTLWWAVSALAAALLCSCSVPGEPVAQPPGALSSSPVSVPPSVRQFDDQGRMLPFRTDFPNRWSEGNNGTPYEPCTSVMPDALRELGIAPDSVADAASVNYQTLRGCKWKLIGSRFGSAHQIVGNAPSANPTLDGYKTLNSAVFHWHPSRTISGREVLVSSLGGDNCSTHVLSGRAIVTTSILVGTTPAEVDGICERAIAFTRATIDQIPR